MSGILSYKRAREKKAANIKLEREISTENRLYTPQK